MLPSMLYLMLYLVKVKLIAHLLVAIYNIYFL